MSVLETLEICFRANLDGVDGQLEKLTGRLGSLDGAALASGNAMEAAGREMVRGVRSGFLQAEPGLLQQLADCGARMDGALLRAVAASGAEEKGRNLSRLFAKGMDSGRGQAEAAAREVAAAARFDAGEAQAKSAGRQLAAGFASGIRGGSGAVNAAVKAMVSSATAKIRSMLQIHSPSKVAAGLGGYFGEGFAQGISGASGGVESASAALGRAAGAGLASAAPPSAGIPDNMSLESMVKAAVDDALGGASLTVPLYVDGMKLGEASIRGINAVTRSAGRVLLNL